MLSEQQDKRKIRHSLNKLRESAGAVGDVPQVVAYLQGRGLIVPPNLQAHPRLPYYEGTDLVGRYPAMLAKVTSPGGRPVVYHRTYLTQDGTKGPVSSPRKRRKPPKTEDTEGYAIRLWPATDAVCIAGGIKTAIAYHLLWGYPAWSVISANGMRKFEPPEGIKNIVIAGDNDANHTGQSAAYEAAKKLKAAGYDVDVRIPEALGDWNDTLAAQGAAVQPFIGNATREA